MVASTLRDLIVGLDLGATNCRAITLNLDGAVVATARRSMPPLRRTGLPERVESDPISMLDVAFGTIREVVDASDGGVAGIGVSSQMHGVVALDRVFQPLTPFISWQDRRALELVPGSSRSHVDFLGSVLAAVQWRAGCELRPGALGPIAHWFASHAETLQGTLTFLGDFVVSSLTGVRPAVAPTQAAGSCVYDLGTKNWLEGFTDHIALPESTLPDLLPAPSVVGKITDAVAKILGISSGVPVVSSIGDHQAALMGAGLEPGDISVNVGTGAQVSILPSAAVRPNPLLSGVEVRPFGEDRHLVCRAGLPGGREVSVLVDFFDGLTSPGAHTSHWHARLEAEAAELEVSFVPKAVTGFATGDGGGFDGLTRETFSAGGLYRGLLESMSSAYVEASREISMHPDLGSEKPRRVLCSGGVCRRSNLLREEIGKGLGIPVVMGPYEEEAAAGAALHARDVLDN